jgi:hypothetical protein
MNHSILDTLRSWARLPAALVALTLVTGCAVVQAQKKTEDLVKVGTVRTTATQEQHAQRAAEEVPLFQRMPGLWVSDRIVPRNAAQTLPPVFDQPFAYRSIDPTPLGLFAADLQRATGTPVKLLGDSASRSVMLDFVGTGRQAMESLPSRYGVTWEFTDGAIVIMQSVTKIFRIERSGVDVGGMAGNRKDPWVELEANIKAIAPNARTSISRNNNTITVVGAPLAMPDIEKLVNLDARSAARRVVLRWQLVNFKATEGGEAGIALDVLLRRAGGTASLVVGSPSQAAGAGVLTLTKSGGSTDGSSYALSLLNQSGNTVVVREGFVPLQQNDTQEFGNTRTIYYASKSSLVTVPTSSSGSTVGNTAVVTEQSSINVGLDGKFGISVFDSELAELSYELSVTVLDSLRKQQSAIQYQEYPETSQRRARGRIRVQHGQTYVISTDTAESASFDRRGLLPGQAAVLGGNVSASQTNDQWLLLVTPIITNSAF